MALGDFANATCPGCVANVSSSTALGNSASATTTNAVAVGQSASVQAVNGTAFGANAVVQAGATNSVAIGQGSVATQANTVSFGSSGSERRLTNVAAGVNPTDAVNVSQLSSIASGLTAGFQSQIDGLQGQVNQVNQRVDTANAGVAMAMALAGGFLPDQKTFAIGFNYGTFQRQNAAAISTHLRLSEHVVLSGGLSYGVEAQQFGGRAGMLFAW